MENSIHVNNAISLDDWPKYTYLPLSDSTRNIRLIELLPGNPDDDVRIRIEEVTLEGPKAREPSGRLSLGELRRTIPQDIDCEVWETIHGRFGFEFEHEDGVWKTSWIHPSPDFDKNKYFFPEPIKHGEPRFEALSYAWGTEPDGAYVIVEGNTSGTSSIGPSATMLRMRPNLSIILRNLRQEAESRRLWIDAICINQADDVERGVQVRQMANIYTLASRVVIWMGLPSKTFDTRKAVDNIVYMSRQLEYGTDDMAWRSPDASEDENERWFDEEWELPFTTLECEGIRDLLNRNWVGRLWVVQEAYLANRSAIMQWGSHYFAVQEIKKVARCLAVNDRLLLPKLRDAAFNIYRTLNIEKGASLSSLLFESLNRECTDPRDRVYGVLGIAPPEVAKIIKPDYGAASTALKVYRDAFLAHLKLTRRIEMFVGTRPNPSPGWPSWVPDWQATGLRRMASYQFSSGCSSAHYSFEAPNTLQVLGVRSTVVSWVEEEEERIGVYGVKVRVESLMARCQADPSTSYIGGGSMGDALAWTATQGRCNDYLGTGYISLMGIWDSIMNSQPSESGSDTKTLTFAEAQVLDTCEGRRFIATTEGYIGLCPMGVEIGKR